MIRPPVPPTYFFLIDVSKPSIKSGAIKIFTETLKAIINKDMALFD